MSRAGRLSIDQYAARFSEEPGYLDFARYAPTGRAVAEENAAQFDALERSRFGSGGALLAQRRRAQEAVAALTGFAPDQIAEQPNTSQALLHAMFGITGGVALSAAEFPSLPFAAQRAADALGVLRPQWLTTDHGRVTAGDLRGQLAASTTAVALSLVDFRTGYLADLEGIRQVIGDRLLVVDATQGFGVVDAPYELVDVLVAGGQKWPRAGWGTGFLALSDRAAEQLTPVWSGFVGTDAPEGEMPVDEVPPPARTAGAFRVSNPDFLALARFSAALEELADVGVPAVNARIAEHVARLIDLADRAAVPVVSPRAEHERAGIVVLEPAPDQLTVLVAALHNHGVTATQREGTVRLAAHASTDEETFGMLAAALLSFSTAVIR